MNRLFNRQPKSPLEATYTAPPVRRVPVSEMIGRIAARAVIGLTGVSTDATKTDFKWWDYFRRGKQAGYELGGLFAEPIGRIQSDWTLGHGVAVSVGHDYTDEQIAEFISDALDTFNEWDYESFTLGDAYLAVNPDGTLTPIPPNLVEKIVNPMNPGETWGFVVTSSPNENTTITDTYTLQPKAERHLVVKQGGQVLSGETFTLLSDSLPIIHIPNGKAANEIYGHPGYEGLRKLFAEYNDVLQKSLDGVKLMGHPIPVIEGADDPEQELENNSTDEETVTNQSGTSITRKIIDFAKQKMFILGKGASFSFKQPGAFTQDAGRMLEYLFLLMLQKSRIPEWVWGGAIASSKASVDSQMPAFALFIESRQRKFEKYLKQVIHVWLQTKQHLDPGLQTGLPIRVEWPGLTQRDEEITLNWATALFDRGLLSGETFLRLSGMVDDPGAEVEKASAAAMNQQALEEAAIQKEIDRMASQRDQADPMHDLQAAA